MKLSKSSWHARLNKYVYGKWYLESVDCLCPYFWGTLLAGLVLPFLALARGIEELIWRLEGRINISIPRPSISEDTRTHIAHSVGWTGVFSLIVIVGYAIGLAILIHGIMLVLVVAGLLALVIGGLVLLALGLIWVGEHIKAWHENRPVKPKKENLFVEMFKAKKNKHCPLVQWD